MALVFGVAFLAVTPPFQVADEFVHFYQAYLVSKGQFLQQVSKDGQVFGEVPDSLLKMAENFHPIPFHPERKASVAVILREFHRPLNPRVTGSVVLKDIVGRSPVLYLPQAIGIGIGRLVGAPPIALLYLGRLANLLSWVALVLLAIRVTPLFKWGLLAAALLPMAVYQAASNSYDALTNGVAFLFIGYILFLAFGPTQTIGRRQLFLLAVLAGTLAQCKQIYVVLGLLFFLVPTRKFASRRQFALAAVALAAVALTSWTVWNLIVSSEVRELMHLGWRGASPQDQLEFIAAHPLTFARTLWASFRVFDYDWIIGHFGWRDTVLPSRVYSVAWAALLFVAVIDHDKQIGLSVPNKLVIAAALVVALAALGTVLYLTWNPLAAGQIEGLQGRYFTPLVPLLLLLLHNRQVPAGGSALRILACLGLAWVLGASVLALIQRFYIAG